MAKKSKTQKAKASAARQQRKVERELEAANPQPAKAEEAAPEKKGLFKKSSDASASSDSGKPAKKAEEKPKKKRFQFLRDVKAEMKRVTWPTRTDVLRWSGVVVVALLFFGIFVAILDNAIITPLLVLISGISLG
ncbi:preprotein translocase subunit SecE [Adlercreutzia muris]|uniref:Protein translocase subunit SecE n=1 Tax=Adlercreutzia muris TaxID=1796610 RepID=A0A7C8G0F8_9ACTN|nr:preprotein translocase subunit SecE [Adlercreutzia muris]MCI8306357.1 preprotein translocase subunit SecE [Enterorhabdus sp.]TGY72904.1 preprotein translocase subunit SecE [Enterorhabdus sp. NM05_H27]KAB1650736.1 preprotein translocase subunit SecE [Adlercreutzia muris]MCI9673982.1 preprotein translocase subunit SecE [Enterorhabdus sp.]MCR2027650.1 preprotein translocase subunit SecE [Adlercreutzia muris]